MSIKRPIVLVTEGSEPGPLQWLTERVQILQVKTDSPAFPQALAQADGMIVRTYTRVTPELLDRAPNLKVIGRGGVGLDNIDLPACRARNIQVVYTPDANTLAVGDYIFGILIQLIRPFAPFRERAYTPQEFKDVRAAIRGRQLNELTLGILGMGRVGRRVGRIASAGFGMKVIYNDLLDVASQMPYPAAVVDQQTLFKQADVVTVHVDMRPGNEHLVNAGNIGLMKPDAILLNSSRGEVLDAHALADAIRANRLAGAAIDVFDPEPPPADFPLLNLPNVILTPHIASRTRSAVENMSWVVRDIDAVLRGQKPEFPAPIV